MEATSHTKKIENSIGNRAVDGLLNGLAAGAAMIVVLIVLSAISGEPPAVLLGRFGRPNSDAPIEGLLSHMAVSGIYGVLFGTLFMPLLKKSGHVAAAALLGGVVFAALLLLAAQTILLPESGSGLLELPFWHWALGHAAYGLALGTAFTRTRR